MSSWTRALQTWQVPRRCCRPGTRQFSMAQRNDDWNTREEFFEFTRGRFVSDEKHNVLQRHVEFDMNELAKVAATSVGAKSCLAIDKCPDGLYNKAYIFTLDDGRQVIGKVPNPIAGIPHFTTASEVATLSFLRTVLKTPVPEVYTWSSTRDDNPVAAEYIIMERMPGVSLSTKWHTITSAQKFRILRQICEFQRSWASIKFSKIGSLYFRKGMVNTDLYDKLYVDANGIEINDTEFIIGPSTAREWIEDGRGKFSCDRGPWTSIEEYKQAIVARERMAVENMQEFPKQDVMVCGPNLYMPTKEKKLDAITALERVLPYILPLQDDFRANHIWHNDLHAENIFVDVDDSTKITGIIDWQSTFIAPMFDQNLEPRSLTVFGAEFGDSLVRPELRSDIDTLPTEERKATLRDYYARGLMVAWRQLIHKKNPVQYNAIKFSNSVTGNLITLGRRLYTLGEAHFMSLVLDLRKEWNNTPAVQQAGNLPFPIVFSAVEEKQIQDQRELADEGIRMMEHIAERLGDLWPDKGLAEHGQYETVKSELRATRLSLISHLDLSPEQEEEFNNFWPFDS